MPMDPPFAWNGTRYLVSPRGETHWARNLRAAGEADLRSRGRREHIRVVEVDGEERDAVVTAYANTITCHCLTHMNQMPDPADHPVSGSSRSRKATAPVRRDGPGMCHPPVWATLGDRWPVAAASQRPHPRLTSPGRAYGDSPRAPGA